jgi:hypothetical protein
MLGAGSSGPSDVRAHTSSTETCVRGVVTRDGISDHQLPRRTSCLSSSRIAALAAPSEVLVSQTVRDLVSGSGIPFEDAGEHELKGVPDRWRLYRLVG